MSKTISNLQDVYAIYDAAYVANMSGGSGSANRAGIRAVVRALRDETAINSCACKFWLDDILGDAGEKVAGVLAVESREGAMISEAPEAPATAPAPAVCVWIDQVKGMAWAGCSGRLHPIKSAVNGCPDCRLPITFSHTEAQR